MSPLTPEERDALQELLDDLIAATDRHECWFGRVRETSLELRDKITEMINEGERERKG
ncbi:hypothetical protein HDA32_002139 [Spinactinospora alkalitolerans]|uniref:Uncharacterized protein n=1 Tax=Spinactinospora alkalitolerans TaxID=687207 RepID=A0A852TSM4_9ACTN|nr:hypothetical protein [Spinactinospora alkalitolerans]NYE47019.1 hypothetical protein [Spinactinospora alkalitolerans]